MPQVKPDIETFAKIKVVGVGGGGGAAIDRMVAAGIRGVEFVAMNTDVQALHHSGADHKLHIGKTVTRGLGAGMNPDIGKRSAEESQNEIRELLKDSDMVFVTCGLGGGTGSGAAPVIAQIAKDLGALTVGVVTKPFSFEGPQRKSIADKAYDAMVTNVDTIITIPNDKVLQIIDKKTSLLEAFGIVDDVLRQGVQGISELITVPGLINVDFADVKTIMSDQGSALMGIGIGTGENRAVEAAKEAISSPLLDLDVDGARGILFTITGGSTLGMQEVAEAAKIVTGSAEEQARVIFGAVIDETMGEDVRITVVATGFGQDEQDLALASFVDKTDIDTDFGTKRPKPKYTPPAIFGKKKFRSAIESSFDEEPSDDDAPSFTATSLSEDAPAPVAPPAPAYEAPKPKPSPAPPMPAAHSTDQDDLEIPAFIRKKMGI